MIPTQVDEINVRDDESAITVNEGVQPPMAHLEEEKVKEVVRS